jgi:hypothetical protein
MSFHMEPVHRHQCLIFEGAPSRQMAGLAAAAKAKLRSNYRCLFVDSEPIVSNMRSSLQEVGVDVAGEIDHGSLILSANQQLADGRFDLAGMIQFLGDTLEQGLRDGYAGLWATGDMNCEIRPIHDVPNFLQYERRMEQFLREHPQFSGICQYHVDALSDEVLCHGLRIHPTIFMNESLSLINPYYATDEKYTLTPKDIQELSPVIHDLLHPPLPAPSVLYHQKTTVGDFQICEKNGLYFLCLDGRKFGEKRYIDPQFVVDDLITGVMDLPQRLASTAEKLPEDLDDWKKPD